MSRMSRRIVVDASVARSAGEAAHPVSRHSREFLQAMLRICHRVVMTKEIRQEWRRHQSNFTYRWLATMTSKRKVFNASVDVARQEALVSAIHGSDLTANQRGAVEKDCLLVNAAWATDNLIASNDDRMRKLLATQVDTTPGLAQLIWVNPTAPDETPIQWLESGARDDNNRRLDARREVA
jgi:hypothetical protein